MSDLKDLLDREARRVSAKPDALDGVHRRADRRHRTRQVVAGVTALALVAGVGLGAWTVLGEEPDRKTPAAGAWRGTYPHETREQAEQAQERADAGDPAIQWQTHAEEVASDYAATILGWDTVAFDDSLDSPDSVQARVELYVATCEVTREDACREQSIREGRAQQEALLVLERLVREGEGGVWDVTEVFGPASFDHRVQPGWGRLPGAVSNSARRPIRSSPPTARPKPPPKPS